MSTAGPLPSAPPLGSSVSHCTHDLAADAVERQARPRTGTAGPPSSPRPGRPRARPPVAAHEQPARAAGLEGVGHAGDRQGVARDRVALGGGGDVDQVEGLAARSPPRTARRSAGRRGGAPSRARSAPAPAPAARPGACGPAAGGRAGRRACVMPSGRSVKPSPGTSTSSTPSVAVHRGDLDLRPQRAVVGVVGRTPPATSRAASSSGIAGDAVELAEQHRAPRAVAGEVDRDRGARVGGSDGDRRGLGGLRGGGLDRRRLRRGRLVVPGRARAPRRRPGGCRRRCTRRGPASPRRRRWRPPSDVRVGSGRWGRSCPPR